MRRRRLRPLGEARAGSHGDPRILRIARIVERALAEREHRAAPRAHDALVRCSGRRVRIRAGTRPWSIPPAAACRTALQDSCFPAARPLPRDMARSPLLRLALLAVLAGALHAPAAARAQAPAPIRRHELGRAVGAGPVVVTLGIDAFRPDPLIDDNVVGGDDFGFGGAQCQRPLTMSPCPAEVASPEPFRRSCVPCCSSTIRSLPAETPAAQDRPHSSPRPDPPRSPPWPKAEPKHGSWSVEIHLPVSADRLLPRGPLPVGQFHGCAP